MTHTEMLDLLNKRGYGDFRQADIPWDWMLVSPAQHKARQKRAEAMLETIRKRTLQAEADAERRLILERARAVKQAARSKAYHEKMRSQHQARVAELRKNANDERRAEYLREVGRVEL